MESRKERDRKIKNNNFGAVRLIAALFVMAGHMHILAGKTVPVFYGMPVQEIGVSIFFVIGGYLISKSWIKSRDFAGYICRRCFRIFPALIFCVCTIVFLAGPAVTSLSWKEYFSDRLTWKYLMNSLLYINHSLPGVFLDNPYPAAVNGSLWSLPVEFMMYLFLPLWINTGRKMTARSGVFWAACTAAAVLAACIFGAGGGIGETHLVIAGRELGQVLSPVVRVVPYEMAGSLIAVCGLEKYLNLQVSVLLLAVLAVLGPVPAFVSCLAAYCFLPYAVLAFALADRPYFSAVNNRDLSYGIYLFSFPIQQILVQVFLYHGIALHVFALMVLSVLLSVAAGFLTERLVENPVQRLQKNMFC